MPLKREAEANNKTTALEKAIEVFYSRKIIFIVETVVVSLFNYIFIYVMFR